MKLLVTGASGLLGLNLAIQASETHEVTGVVHNHSLKHAPFSVLQADLADPVQVDHMLDKAQPDAIIHCAAKALLDECESNPQQAVRMNAEIPGYLAGKALQLGFQFVSISTDGVFDGQRRVYREEDIPNPLSAYARSKLAGEQAVAQANPDALIVRANFYGWSLSGVRSLAEHFFYNLKAGRQVSGFSDVIFCPLLVNELAGFLLALTEKQCSGLYHLFSRGSMSKYDFGVALARMCGFDESLIQKISIAQAGLKAARSPYLEMCSEKAEACLGRQLPGPADGLAAFFHLYQEGYPQRLLAMGQI